MRTFSINFSSNQITDSGINGLVVGEIGEAIGHDIFAGSDAIDQIVEQGNKEGNLKCRWGHPSFLSDPVGTEIGFFTNFRRDSQRALADLVFITDWQKSPLITEKVQHLQTLAKGNPELIALSIEFKPGELKEPSDILNTQKLPEENIEDLRAIAITSDGALTPNGLFSQITDNLMSLFKPNKNQEDTKQFNTQVELENGNLLNLPSTTPNVGDPVELLDSEGNQLDSAGQFQADGYNITVEDGVVKTISLGQLETEQPSDGEDEPQPETQEASNSTEENSDNSEQVELQSKVEELEKQLNQLNDKQPAAKPHKVFNNVQKMNHFTKNPENSDANTEDLVDSTLRLYKASRGLTHNGEKLSYRKGNKDMNKILEEHRATGATFNGLLDRAPEVLQEIFHQNILVEGLVSRWNLASVPTGVNGSGSLTIELPNMDHTSPQFLQQGIDCEPTSNTTTNFSKRNIEVKPFTFFHEYCPLEWGNFMRGGAFVNDEQIPFQAEILNFLIGRIQADWENTLMNGDFAGGGAFDGLRTILKGQQTNDPTTFGEAVIVPTASDAVAEFEKLIDAAPDQLLSQFQDTPLSIYTNPRFKNFYDLDFRTKFTSLPRIDEFGQTGVESGILDNRFIPSIYMPQTLGTTTSEVEHILTPDDNIWFGMEEDPTPEVGFSDTGSKQALWIRLRSHSGINVADASKVVIGTNTAF